MRRRYKIGAGIIAGLAIGVGIAMWSQTAEFQVLDAQGEVAKKQLDLLIFASTLSLFVMIPVFALVAFISLRYREGNRKVHLYRPTWDHSNVAETIWWGLPALLIGVLSVIIWTSSHDLDPYKPLVNDKKPVNVQVVALQWRWLFIYPDEKIATINHLTIPEKTPINFTITADAPMNSFWIPKLGGQVYAMNGMSTKLHLMADSTGDFNGSSVNLSGKGFSKMKFITTATSETQYKEWVKQARAAKSLDWEVYTQIAKPTEKTEKQSYKLEDAMLYDKIIEKYMPMHETSGHMKEHGE
ncbi:ubiquinol oxidase subunit II [Candidatus Saccharibacteria bacterium]|nr:ubiquinol oxidase subunit II [Candidatus Saccharibacteria bacterium]